jgi:L-fucose isomerase-like protein
VLATHAQKGLPAFGIYGHDVQNLDEVTNIPADVQEKLLRFGRAAVAVATMRGKSYLQIGSICMGIGGSIIDPAFIEEYLGMRVESVDEVEIIRRMSEGVFDAEEVAKAKAWIKEHCLFRDETTYKRNSEYGKFISMLCSYTMAGKNKNDDVPDAMAMLAEYAQSLGASKVEVFQRPW